VSLAILRRDIGDLDLVALRLDLLQADEVGALADVTPFREFRESPDPVFLAIRIGRLLDEFACASICRSVNIDPYPGVVPS